MPRFHSIDRRLLLAEVSRTTFALAVLGGTALAMTTGDDDADGLAWHRVSFGFVSAYILVRGSEAAIVDTGLPGSEPQIGEGLTAAGLGWDAVRHVVFTHLHPDHIGSSHAVLSLAGSATGYAGPLDLPAVESPRPLTAVDDEGEVFGMAVVATPGHTPGHICVLDPEAGVLVAGDAIREDGGSVIGPNPDFTEDMATAHESVRKLAGLSYDTVLFGHGEPVVGGASAAVADLAAGL